MNTADNIPSIDVRTLPPSHRHSTIFGLLTALGPGGSMLVTSDHDPHALHYQIAMRYPDRFGWTYIEEGPEVWRVRITREDAAGPERRRDH